MDSYQFTEELSTELSGKPKRCGGRVSIAPAQQLIFCFFFSFNDDFFFLPDTCFLATGTQCLMLSSIAEVCILGMWEKVGLFV